MSNKNGDIELVFPSTELIQDEYLQRDNKLGIVHIFTSEREKYNGEQIKQTLLDLHYNIDKINNIHPIDTKEGVEKDLINITNNGSSEASCLIVFFFGRIKDKNERGYILSDKSRERIYIRDVWSKFITCKFLRSKPKIFIFQTTVDDLGVTIDAAITSDKMSYFDFPYESDLFIVYNQVHDRYSKDFVNNLCDKIKKYGKRNDVVNLISLCNSKDNQALQISTLTRKFYFDYDVHRGYSFDIEASNIIKYKIEEIDCAITKSIHKNKSIHSSLPSLDLDNDAKVMSKPSERRRSDIVRPRLSSKGKKPVWKP